MIRPPHACLSLCMLLRTSRDDTSSVTGLCRMPPCLMPTLCAHPFSHASWTTFGLPEDGWLHQELQM